ncbi:hypothetical protein [Luteibacter sahnii]|uniref:hypothetical protein n=1 Tax=Luteibacter sahnii TaxID=3021977 RepID=UPI002A752B17|nr:hypothetical protein [Luteibacter sp. PPL193]MDY1550147.1 hypothetical protein [Luteibacter sp. PPL193]
MSHLSHLSIYGLSRLVFVLAARVPVSGSTLGQGRSRESIITVGQLESVARILDDWPGAFQTHLEERYAQQIQKDPFSEAFRSLFAWAFHTLDNTSGRTGPDDFAFLKDQVLKFGARYLPRERLLRGRNGQKPMSCRWGTILEAAAQIGMDPRTLAKRVKAGQIPSLEADQHRRNRNFLVDMDWLRTWKLSRYAPVHVRDAADAIGISVALLRALRVAGIYEPLYQTAKLSSYSEEDVSRFAELLRSLAQLYSNDGTVGGIRDDKVNLRTSKSVEARVKLLLSLKGRHPELWSVEAAQPDEAATAVEVEVYGHLPVLVARARCSAAEDARIFAVLRPSDPPIATVTVDEMIGRLIAEGVRERDITLPISGQQALDEGVRAEFLSVWKDRWRDLRGVENELLSMCADWVADRRVYKYLRGCWTKDALVLEREKNLLGVWLPVTGCRIYPAFQFQGFHVKPGIRELLYQLPDDSRGWAQLRWLATPSAHLDGKKPFDVADGALDAVVQAAAFSAVDMLARLPS